MNDQTTIRLTGQAISANAGHLFTELAEHFVEHAEVIRADNHLTLISPLGTAEILHTGERLAFDLSCPSPEALMMSRTVIAEHLFYFAGSEALDLTWADLALPKSLPNLHLATLVSASVVTPSMRRLVFACADVTPFISGDMHVRLLLPPTGRTPVWPTPRNDGRIDWPTGEDALLSRAYTIRSIDSANNQVSIDFFQHPEPGVITPGADFARDALPGTQVALLGPGSGGLPKAPTIFLAGDESALPAIARIIEELPSTSTITALIEVWDASEEQLFAPQGALEMRWVHRQAYAESTHFSTLVLDAIATQPGDAFLWVACEKTDLRAVKASIRKTRPQAAGTYLAWYWSHDAADAGGED